VVVEAPDGQMGVGRWNGVAKEEEEERYCRVY